MGLASLVWIVPTFLLAILVQDLQSTIFGLTGTRVSGGYGTASVGQLLWSAAVLAIRPAAYAFRQGNALISDQISRGPCTHSICQGSAVASNRFATHHPAHCVRPRADGIQLDPVDVRLAATRRVLLRLSRSRSASAAVTWRRLRQRNRNHSTHRWQWRRQSCSPACSPCSRRSPGPSPGVSIPVLPRPRHERGPRAGRGSSQRCPLPCLAASRCSSCSACEFQMNGPPLSGRVDSSTATITQTPFPPLSTVDVYALDSQAHATHFYLLGSDGGGRDLVALTARAAVPSLELVALALVARMLLGIGAGAL